MDGLRLVAEHDGHRHEIVEDPTVGFYVFRYVAHGPQTTDDYLQDNIEMAKSCAESEFGVPRNAWRAARAAERPAYKQ